MTKIAQREDWDGVPRELGSGWTRRKDDHIARCRLWTHWAGFELQLHVDGDLLRTEVCRTPARVLEVEADWQRALADKGWTNA